MSERAVFIGSSAAFRALIALVQKSPVKIEDYRVHMHTVRGEHKGFVAAIKLDGIWTPVSEEMIA